ncbi:mucin-3A-like [Haliotis asinina]|uniref:mucin-3A-like n=1 Tax=Haliotis asinina TaxID=109174 RepID=UPI003531AC5C
MNLHYNGGWLDISCNDKKISVCEADSTSNHIVGHVNENGVLQCNASVVTSFYSSDVTTAVVTAVSSDPVEVTFITPTALSGTQPSFHFMATTTEPLTSFLSEPTPSVTATSASSHTDPTTLNTEAASRGTQVISSTLASIGLLPLTDTTYFPPYGPTVTSKDMGTKLTDDHNPPRVTREVCRCACIPRGRLSQLSPHVVKKKEEEIRRELILNTKNLTKTIANFKTAEDERKSAVGIGMLGVFLMTFPMTLMILSDLCTVKFQR